jgi:hypothetical protein
MKKSKFNTLCESYISKLLAEADVTKKTVEDDEQETAEIPQEVPNSSGGSALPSAQVGPDGETTVDSLETDFEAQLDSDQPEEEVDAEPTEDEAEVAPAPLTIQDVELMVACLKFGQNNIKIDAKDLAIFNKPITPKNKDIIVQRLRELVENQTDVAAV